MIKKLLIFDFLIGVFSFSVCFLIFSSELGSYFGIKEITPVILLYLFLMRSTLMNTEKNTNLPLIIWVSSLLILLFILVLVGGATRITDSGLSITEWEVLIGILPPLSESSWIIEFEKYKKIPEYILVNSSMTLSEFKVIYLWEWGHRLLARLVGLVCVIPLIIFYFMKKLSKPVIRRSVLISILIGIQGYIGWYMVQSGLTQRVDVSQYRLSIHLLMAFIIIYNTLMLLFEVTNIKLINTNGTRPIWFSFFSIIVFVQIFSGGLMSGLDAGLVYPTWPLMGLSIVPSDYWIPQIEIYNLFENRSNVQFNHRTLGYLILLLGLLNVYLSRNNYFMLKVSLLTLLLIFVQIALGIFTIILMVPWETALLHQFFSLLVFSSITFSLYLSRFGK